MLRQSGHELDPVDVELLPVLEPVLSTAVVSPVDPAGTVVISGVLEKPDEPEAGAWQAASTAKSVSRGQLGLMRRSLARPGSTWLPPVTLRPGGPTGDRLGATTRAFLAGVAVMQTCGGL